jgi:signal transduction histidine kinase
VRTTLLQRAVLVLTLLAVGAATVLILGVSLVGRPLHALINATRRIGGGDLETRVSLRGHDELDELASALDAMAAEIRLSQERLRDETARRLATMEELRHADRLRTVGRLASGIAHELGTPLNVVSGRAAMIEKRQLDEQDVVESAAIIRAQAGRMTEIVRQLLDFARRPRTDRSVVDLAAVARAVSSLVEPLARKRGIEVTVDAPDLTATSGDPAQLEQIVTNLVINAVQASSSGARVVVMVDESEAIPPPDHPRQPGRYARLRVLDHGVGMSEDEIQHVFEPFFTTKDVGEGTGLGLSIVYSIVQDHGGWIDVSSSPTDGTCFTVHLPGVET